MGERSSGPMGSMVAGFSGGSNGIGRSGRILYHDLGISFSSSIIFVLSRFNSHQVNKYTMMCIYLYIWVLQYFILTGSILNNLYYSNNRKKKLCAEIDAIYNTYFCIAFSERLNRLRLTPAELNRCAGPGRLCVILLFSTNLTLPFRPLIRPHSIEPVFPINYPPMI